MPETYYNNLVSDKTDHPDTCEHILSWYVVLGHAITIAISTGQVRLAQMAHEHVDICTEREI